MNANGLVFRRLALLAGLSIVGAAWAQDGDKAEGAPPENRIETLEVSQASRGSPAIPSF